MRLLVLFRLLLLAAFRPVPDSPALRRRPVVHRPRHAAPPPRQARTLPPRIPSYTGFAACARRHSALWEVTYTHGVPCPYVARNRVTGSTVAVDDVDLLDHILATYEHPHPVRGYYGQHFLPHGHGYGNSRNSSRHADHDTAARPAAPQPHPRGDLLEGGRAAGQHTGRPQARWNGGGW
ncbi:hypothetical protein [Thermobifida cellulosilytica]|uniref:hypothetical protein n=1 Tax=Thermobifida cellulosilytica TaxID=144786 RepID=UPI000A91E1E8|nr:hypothetical protein [Thermobifida cellulosilytica]